MTQRYRIAFVTTLAGLVLFGATGCTKLRARDHLNKGVQAYKNAQYPDAVEQFKAAVELDPEFATARLYLATAYMSQYIPGADSPDNNRMAQLAHEEFLRVLEKDPNNSIALASIASLYFHQKKFDESEQWFKKLIAAHPDNKEAYYTLGVIAWTRTFQKRMTARAEMGMKPEDPGPLKDKKVREKLKAENLPIIEEGLKYLQKAVEIDPEYDDAMAYLNLLYRERADLQDTKEAYEKDIEVADNWVDKTLATKKAKAARSQQQHFGITE
jgi:tetratricopeptide (TPR) repeat protein